MFTPDKLMTSREAKTRAEVAEREPESIPSLSRYIKQIAELVYTASEQGEFTGLYRMQATEPWLRVKKILERAPYSFMVVRTDEGNYVDLHISWASSTEEDRAHQTLAASGHVDTGPCFGR